MMSKTKSLVFIAFSLLATVLVASFSSAALAEWQLTADGTASNVHVDVSAGDFTGGTGISGGTCTAPSVLIGNICFTSDGARATSWPLNATGAGGSGTLESDSYFQITLTPDTGKSIAINNINFGERRSATGIRDYQVQWSKSSAFTSPMTIATVNVPNNDLDRDGSIAGLNIVVNSGETIYIRLFGYNAEGSAGTWRINDATLNVQGTVSTSGGNASSFTITKTRDLTQSQSGELRVTNNGTTSLTDITLSSSGDFNVAFSTNHFNLAAGANQLVTVSSNDLDNLDFGNNVATVTVQPQGLTSQSVQFSVVGSFCSDGQQGGNLSISSINIDNQGDGDDNSWIYLDVIEVEVKVKNKGSEKVRDVTVELGLFDADGSNQIDELDFESADAEQINLGSFSKGDTDTATFKFRIPATLDADDYKFAVKVYSDDIGESDECIDKSSSLSDNLFESVSIDTQDEEGKFIAFENIVVSPSQATCGDSVLLTTDVYNIGDNDEDQVKVILKNTEMKINEAFEITGGLDQGDKKTISFSFIVPQGLQTKTYNLELSSEYDYRSGTYRQASDESAKIPLSVLGCTPSTGGTGAGQNIAAISAKLSSEAKAGEELIVTSTITNLQSSSGTFIIDASGYDSWAELTDISERVVQINGGQSKQVTFTFNVNSAVEGEESFDIEIRSGETTQTKEVAVNIAAPAKTTPSFNLGENSYLWIIGIVNVVLIVLIIVVAVRISRR